jgi:hypothetical protein
MRAPLSARTSKTNSTKAAKGACGQPGAPLAQFDVSVVVPTYRRSALLAACLAALCDQGFYRHVATRSWSAMTAPTRRREPASSAWPCLPYANFELMRHDVILPL